MAGLKEITAAEFLQVSFDSLPSVWLPGNCTKLLFIYRDRRVKYKAALSFPFFDAVFLFIFI